MNFINSFQSEWIKTKNSAVMWLTIAGALFVPVIITISRLVQHNQTLLVNSSQGAWMKIFNQNWQFMAVLLLPMGIILASSLLAQIEFRNNTWKQVYTTPQKISTIFWAKYAIVFFVLIQFFFLFNLGIYLSVVLPSFLLKDVPYPTDAFPYLEYIERSSYYFLWCLPIVALQYLLSLHIRNFIIPMGIGLALTVAALIAINNQYGYIMPYTYGGMKFLVADNRIDESINISKWALGYFLYFSLANYLIFFCKTQVTQSKYLRVKPLIFVLSVGLVLALFLLLSYNKNNNKKSFSSHNPEEIEQLIRQVENNLGAHDLDDNNDNPEWTLTERMKFHKVKGLSIAVIHNYKIEWAKGYGLANEEENVPVTTNTLFEPGSLSKSVNALALMHLVQNKKIDLFADINLYLHTWKFPYDQQYKGKTISLANLLSHTAGLSVRGFEGYRQGDSLPNMLQILDGQKPANSKAVRSIFEPNKKMEYSGGGTMISQLMMMDVAKSKYDNYMAEHILKPLQMTNSFYSQPIPESKKPIAATGYDSLGKVLPYKYPIMVEQAAAGLWTTPTDMCKFIIEIQKSLMGTSNKIINQKNTELMLTPYIDERSALGFFVDDIKGHKYFSHEAGNWGFSGAYYGSMKDGYGVAIFINSENDQIIKELGNNVIEVYNWGGFDKKEKRKTVVVQDNTSNQYLGAYEAKVEKRKLEIVKENNTLYLVTNKQKMKIYFVSNSEFVNMENPSIKTFQFENKKVRGLKIKFRHHETYFAKTR
ncbi:MAG: serine hydrolase [Saprospiraceae bacterium]|jgi:CubicO group peptidase (beta-lactamase class C family)|nr:serine hydrolase [Saprospiraceae bacterium]